MEGIIFIIIDFKGKFKLNKLVDLGYAWHSSIATAEFKGKAHRYIFSVIDESRIRLTIYPMSKVLPLSPSITFPQLNTWIVKSLECMEGQ